MSFCSWILNNKIIVFLSVTTLMLSAGTVTLGILYSNLNDEVKLNKSVSTTAEPNTTVTITTITTTRVPSTTSETTINPSPNPEPDGWRLPKDIYKPISYDLTLRPDLETGLVSGRVTIKFKVETDLDVIKINNNGLTITRIYNPFDMFSCSDSTDEKDILTIWCIGHGGVAPKPGEYEIVIDFRGDMKNKFVGLYRSSYENNMGKTRYLATSKLEPTYARQAFPCFDEPNYKANYTVHLQIPKGDGYIALSNMDQEGYAENIPGDDEHQMVHFYPSVPMSTYMSCFIVCDFEYTINIIASISGKGISLKVYATRDQLSKTLYALGIAKRVIEYYETYFNISYPLPKLDMIAIPDFMSDAKENWGLVTYSETALLYNEATSSAADKQRVATVVAHELAHIWFGNLVTMDWWNDLWLNEGFATYMQFKAINYLQPDWGMADQFLIDNLHSVLDFDSTLATHPIVVSVSTPNQITEIFDSISYNKGASVLRMLENAIGEEKFQEGIHNYLEAHAYGNAVTKDLWKELQDTIPETDLSVEEVMDTWTVQPGYPIITVTKEYHIPNASFDEYTLHQKRFFKDPYEPDLNPKGYIWNIPITYITDLNPNQINITWFKKDDILVTLEFPWNTKWVKFNHRQVGFYRVNYFEGIWRNLTTDFHKLHTSDKTNLLDDSFSIAKSGELLYRIPLRLSLKMKTEKEYVPWTVTIRKFDELKPLMKNDYDVYTKFQKYVLSLLENIYGELRWDTNEKIQSTHQHKLLRAQILDAACAYEHEDCKKIAKQKFQEWLITGYIDKELKTLVYKYGMEDITKVDWDKVFEIYMKKNDATEKLKLLQGLASVKDITILNILLDRAKNETIIRSQDYFTCLQYISHNDYGTELVWNYVREHWEELVERFTLNDRYLGRLIPAITSRFITETKLSEMDAFFRKYPNAGASETSRKQALETVRNNIKWIKNYYKEVKDWLSF